MQPLDPKSPEFLSLGRISGLFGVKGWVKVFSDTQPRENITQYPVWWLHSPRSRSRNEPQNWQEYKVVRAQPHGKTIIASLAGIDSREAAAQLIGFQVGIPRDALPKPDDGEYYWADLIGCQVVGADGAEMGRVIRMFETGANDVLVVKGETDEILIPWVVPSVVVSVDIAARQLVVDWDPDY